MAELQYIEIEKLYPHPDNPRKELGDVTELADSIRQNGIFQNLTVVPDEEGYTVIIGHRRMAAAKAAGLKTVPCIVADMTPKEQLQTMLLENMQRTDLTVYEQAQGFQLMLDMGSTIEEIAEKSGFSQSTVRRRVKLLDLDPEEFKKSEARGATLSDYMELDKIADPELKNRALAAVGTANFDAEVRKAVEDEKVKLLMEKWISELAQFAARIKKRGEAEINGETVSLGYVEGYYRWDKKKEVQRPEDADNTAYYFYVDNDSITLYRELQQQQRTETEEERRHRELAAARQQQEGRLEEITKRHFELRRDFIKGYGGAKSHRAEIMLFAVNALFGEEFCSNEPDPEIFDPLLGAETDENIEFPEYKAWVMARAEQNPEYTLLAAAYAALDDESVGYWDSRWNGKERLYSYKHIPNDKLDGLYKCLCALGYGMSDEEKAMQDGTHEAFEETSQ